MIYVANKADSPRRDAEAYDLYRLGVKDVLPVSSLHGRGIGELETAIVAKLPKVVPDEADDPRALRVAIVGRPNAGKSSLVNKVLGESRMLVDDRPGTTRDAMPSTRSSSGAGKRYVLVDTAGIRRKAKVQRGDDAIETLAVMSAIRSIERAAIVVVLCDASEGVSEQDAKVLGLAHERNRAMIVALNKTDLLDKKGVAKAIERAKDKLTFAPYVPIVTMSVKAGRGVGELFETIDRVNAGYVQRVSTGELNRFFAQVLDTRPPPTMGRFSPRLYFITQVSVAPPTFVAMTNAPDAIHFSYQRYVQNQLRKRFGFEGSPIIVHYRQKRGRAAKPGGTTKEKGTGRSRAHREREED